MKPHDFLIEQLVSGAFRVTPRWKASDGSLVTSIRPQLFNNRPSAIEWIEEIKSERRATDIVSSEIVV